MANIPHPIRNSEIISLEQARGLGYLLQSNNNYGGRIYHEWWAECKDDSKPFLAITQDPVKKLAILELDLFTANFRFSKEVIKEFKKNNEKFNIGITKDRLTISHIPLHRAVYVARQLLNTLNNMIKDDNEA